MRYRRKAVPGYPTLLDPRKLKGNPNNPRRTSAGDYLDAQMLASIKAIGLLQPPLVKEEGKKLIIQAGHRRTAACVAAGLPEIPVLVIAEADAMIDPMRSISENLVRADMGQVDRWRSMEALAAAGWNEAAIADALGMTPRNIAQARLLANICPAMLDQMAKNDVPDGRQLRVIAAATKEEQTEVWKQHKPKRGHQAPWSEIAHGLNKVRVLASNARFGNDEAQVFGIVWQEDLFAPADEDSRSTTQVDAYLAAQHAWLEANMGERGCIVETDDYQRPKLPRGAQQHWKNTAEDVMTAFSVDQRTGVIREYYFTLPAAEPGETAAKEAAEPVRKARPDLTGKGAAMIGDFRTDALHQALREKPIDDDQLIGMLVLALAGNNVTVQSGVVGRHGIRRLGSLAETLTEGGVLTRDLDAIRYAARETLVEVLSCRENHSASGMGARHAGAAIDADAYLPNMATAEFLPALSRSTLEGCAAGHSIRVWPRVKDTREAIATHFRNGTFILPAARFAPTETELEARRNPASIIADAGKGNDRQPEKGKCESVEVAEGEDAGVASTGDEVGDQDDDEADQKSAEADTGIVGLIPPAAVPVQAEVPVRATA